MLDLLKRLQPDLMLILSGCCLMLVRLTFQTKTLSPKRRRILGCMQFAAALLLIFDRLAYLYRGVPGTTAFYIVRISNFLVYALSLYLPHSFNLYLFDLFRNEGKLKDIPGRLTVNEALFTTGLCLLVISQFTGLYYTFDGMNTYRRSAWQPVCYIIPLAITVAQLSVILQYRKLLRRRIIKSLILYTALSLMAAVIQFFVYGLSLTNIALVGMVVLLYVFALTDMNETVERSKELEIKYYRDEQQRVQLLFEQTAEALVTAIDAKDPYTHGHSTRVAEYSEKIAHIAGKDDEECRKVYYAALLHDVGKIGIADQIINKNDRLTNEEYRQIRHHPEIGSQILSGIKEAPYLSVGAHYHHERYDGHGYPDGLAGGEIPETARIIGVADAYDTMTSRRKYRDPLSQQEARKEVAEGAGTQFDPKFAQIMLQMIDEDTDYQMREHE